MYCIINFEVFCLVDDNVRFDWGLLNGEGESEIGFFGFFWLNKVSFNWFVFSVDKWCECISNEVEKILLYGILL